MRRNFGNDARGKREKATTRGSEAESAMTFFKIVAVLCSNTLIIFFKRCFNIVQILWRYFLNVVITLFKCCKDIDLVGCISCFLMFFTPHDLFIRT